MDEDINKEKKDIDNDDEEISIDFSKITNFFKKKKEDIIQTQQDKPVEQSPTETQDIESQDTEEEISIDFSKIKNIFKKKEEKQEDSTQITPSEDSNEESDEELNIDLSKVKNIFKKKEQPAQQVPIKEDIPDEDKKSDDELNIDISKVTGFFKNIKLGQEKESESKEEEISIDWKPVFNFAKKYGYLLLILIPIYLSIYIRMLPEDVPATDRWASDSVYNNLRGNVRNQINQQYPNLPDQNKEELVEREMNNFVDQNKKQINEQIKATSEFFKEQYRDEEGKTYMPDIDPYFWYRYANNIINTGMPSDEVIDGRAMDNYQLAPLGRSIARDIFHAYFLAYFHKFTNFFSRGITLMRTMSYYPVIISALSVLFAFVIGKKIAGNVGGFFSALMLASNQSFIGRTLFGHADSDAWVVFFPLIITLLFIESINSKSTIKLAISATLAGVCIGLFSYTWGGWWYIFDFLLGVAGITFIYLLIVYRKDLQLNFKIFFNDRIKNLVLASIIFFFASLIFVVVFRNFDIFLAAFKPFGLSKIKAPVHYTLWPNVLTTVAELNPGSLDQVVGSVGGKIIWLIGLLGILLALLKRDNQGKLDIKYSLLLAFWLIATTYATILGIRFSLLVAPAFAIAFGTALGMSYIYISKWASKGLHIHKTITNIILIVVFLTFYIQPVTGSINAAKSDIPLINDAWYNSLQTINQNSTSSAIITSWWDFGHHFKALADRRVTFDGTTQTDAVAHWVGRFFSTNDEDEAVGILRMLDCGGGRAAKVLNTYNEENTRESVNLLKEIIFLDKADAEIKLKEYGLDEAQKDEIIQYTHCQPPEGYIIASNDMIGKSGVWGHFGAWNFEKADMWFNVRNFENKKAIEYMMENFNYSKNKAESLYSEVIGIKSNNDANTWIAPWPGYGGTSGCSRSEDNYSLGCDNGFQINLTNFNIQANSDQGIVHPNEFAYLNENNEIKIDKYLENNIGAGLTLVEEDGSYELVISSPEITGGMFTRMFHMGGSGLKHFELIDHQRGATGTEIYVYKVKWKE